jgi:membrane protein implicated in regulation of membrane protease activity
MFLFALVHGITTGTDTGSVWAQVIYWSTGVIFLVLLFYRIIRAVVRKKEKMTKNTQLPIPVRQ